jgi:hypothetical protein
MKVEWFDWASLHVGRIVLLVLGIGTSLTAAAYLFMIPVNYIYRQTHAAEAFFSFMRNREKFNQWLKERNK